MSRIGRHPIAIPAGVTVTVSDDNHVVVKGPKGQLEQTVNKNITVKVEGNEVHVTRPNDEKQNRAFHGLYRALIANMVVGVTEGYKKTLALVGTGYRLQPSRHYEGAAEHFLCYAEPDDHRGLRHRQAAGGQRCGRHPCGPQPGAVSRQGHPLCG